MRGAEQGFLLLTSHLGDPDRHPMTQPQLRNLSSRVFADPQEDPDREVDIRDLMALGYGEKEANRILKLLGDGELLAYYVRRGQRACCVPITPVSRGYPQILTHRLGWERPACLWAKGDLSLLDAPKVSLVGSRELREENKAFAEEVGRQAAIQGYALVSGNARGADRTAQSACLEAGGKVISVVADALCSKRSRDNVLYLSEESFDEAFSAQRALSRNRVIHALGELVFVAQCHYAFGGTWDGTAKNLHGSWSPVFVFNDGSPAFTELCQRGAQPVELADLGAFGDLIGADMGFLTDF